MSLPRPYIPIVLSSLMLVVFFVMFTFPVTDGDCFWHLATGRWIFENHTLPSSDPLSFTVADHNPWRPESNRIPFLLKQYWLGQLALYGTWKLAGAAGIVLLRAVTYTALLAFLLLWMQRVCRGIFPFVLVALCGLLLRDIPNERPQLFSFLFMLLVLILLEYTSENCKKKYHTLSLCTLPVIMLAWANTHAAYLLGVMLIACYLLSHLFSCLTNRSKLNYPLLGSLLSGAAITCLNPTGISAWREFLSADSIYIASIYENLTPWQAALKLHHWYPAYWVAILLAVTGFYYSRATVKPVHLIAMTALIGLSLTGLRYLIFPLLAAPLFVGYLPEISLTKTSAGILVICCAIGFGGISGDNILKFKERDSFPKGAALFMQQQKPAPNSFNHYDWGGYLAFSIPGFKTFIDGRGLVEELSQLHDQAIGGEAWRTIFDTYSINSVIMPGMSETTGNVYTLIEALIATNDWYLVFADASALVFVRDIPANKKLITDLSMNKQAVQSHLVQLANRLIIENSNHEGYWQTKANALQRLGDRQAAVAAYKKTLQLNPDNAWARRMMLSN